MDQLNISLSEHARDVMRRREVTFDEVAEIIRWPQIREVSTGYGNLTRRGQHFRYVVENLAVVVAEERRGDQIFRTVVTVLLREDGQWSDEDVRTR
jgi:hypothetical protein